MTVEYITEWRLEVIHSLSEMGYYNILITYDDKREFFDVSATRLGKRLRQCFHKYMSSTEAVRRFDEVYETYRTHSLYVDTDIDYKSIPTSLTNEEINYIKQDRMMLNSIYGIPSFLKLEKETSSMFDIDRVIFNDPATIVFWKDGTKTVVKCENEEFDEEKGLAMAISKKALGNEGKYYNTFSKWLPESKETEESSSDGSTRGYAELCKQLGIPKVLLSETVDGNIGFNADFIHDEVTLTQKARFIFSIPDEIMYKHNKELSDMDKLIKIKKEFKYELI